MTEDGFYRVCWYCRGSEVSRNAFDNLVEAKNFAKERLRIQKVRKDADCARVIDTDGVTYFEFVI